jgi:DNA polymerase elongation subunit (family B)
MIIVESNNNIHLRWRDDENIRVSRTVENYFPFFYIKAGSQMPEVIDMRTKWGTRTIHPNYTWGNWKNLDGEELVKVSLETVGDLFTAKDYWENTYEADISMARKYSIDNIEKIHEYNLRKWYLDIETQVGGRYDKAINALTFYDSYDEEYFIMTWFPREPLPQYDNVLVYEDEQEMLEAFVSFMEEKDPDMIIGWYLLGFDIPSILKRLIKNEINPRRLSPMNDVKGVTHREFKYIKYTNTAQPIKGRITYCLMTRFERLWLDNQRGTLPSLSLDYCSKRLLGEDAGKEKTDAKFSDEEFFQRSWLEDTEVFLEYNRVDVELMVRMDKEMNISENDLALQKLLICPFDCVFYNSQMGASYFMRHAEWKAPTGVKGNKQKYEAAFVMNPIEENTYGLHKNIAVFDFKSLYPSMMAARNISWETKNEEGYDIYFDVPKNLIGWEKEVADVSFGKNPLGLLPKAVLSLMKMRDGYKQARKDASNAEEYIKWDSAQMATKRAVNAFYGVLAKDGYGWGDMDMAQAITASAREAMRAVAFKTMELGYRVIYGHTDSIFVEVAGVADAKQLCIRLNNFIRNEKFNECVELEFEKYASLFFLSQKKNRYSGYLTWKDGKYLDEEEFFVMGFEMKKSNETKLAKAFQSTVLKMVSSNKTEDEVTKYARDIYQKVSKGEYDQNEVVKRSRLRTPLEEYKTVAGGTAGVLFYNQEIGSINLGDSYYYYTVDNKGIKKFPRQYEYKGYIRNVDYIAFKKIDEVINYFPIAWKRLADSEVVKKVTLIYDSLGWDVNEISQKGKQTRLDEW